MWAPMRIVSPGMCNVRSERSMVTPSTCIFQWFSDVVVSSGTESFSWMSNEAPSSAVPFTSTFSFPRSMPLLDTNSRSKRPFTRAAAMNPLVLRLVLVISSSLMTTLLAKSGSSCTSTTIRCMSAMVSMGVSLVVASDGAGDSTRTSLTAKSRGKASRT